MTMNILCLPEDEDDGQLLVHIACSTPSVEFDAIQLLLETSPETSESVTGLNTNVAMS
jgi:hypothetical protein